MELETRRKNLRLTKTPIGYLPSVSLILSETADKSTLKQWEKKVGFLESEKRRKESVQRGLKLDAEIKHYFETGWVDQSEYFQQSYTVISEFSDHIHQQLVWHPIGFTGRFDYLGIDETGRSVLVEWKTSDKPKAPQWTIDAQLQAVAYLKAAEYSLSLKISEARVVYCITDHQLPEIYPISGDKIDELFKQFCIRLEQYQQKQIQEGF